MMDEKTQCQIIGTKMPDIHGLIFNLRADKKNAQRQIKEAIHNGELYRLPELNAAVIYANDRLRLAEKVRSERLKERERKEQNNAHEQKKREELKERIRALKGN